MSVKFENKDVNEGVLTFEISTEEVNKGLDRVFKRVRKDITVPGFRKGRVPRPIFNNIYGEEVLYEDTLNELLPGAYQSAVEQAELEVVSQPVFDVESMEKGQAWVITASVAIKPEVKLGQYTDLEVAKQNREVTEDDVRNELAYRQADLAELVLKDSAAEEGDTVVIDYEGSVDGEVFDGGTADNYSLELGSNTFIPGFEEQLIGVEPNSQVDVNVTFPEEYHAEDLAGKDAVFKVTVHEVKTKELPELDDEFAKDLDEGFETLEELTNSIREELEKTKNEQADEAIEDEALSKAVENAEVVGGIPQGMLDSEIDRQVEYFLNNLQQQGINSDLYYQITNTSEDDLRAQYAEGAETRTKTNLVLEAIIAQEQFEVTEEDRNAEVDELAEQHQLEADQVRQFVTDDMLNQDIKMKRAMSLIIDSAKEV